ncbi:MAG: metallophosphoesterase family protein [Pyrobaculum sp.]
MRSLLLFFLVATLVFSSIVDPRWAVPTYVEPGGWFNITLDGPIAVKSVSLTAPGVAPISLEYVVEGSVIRAKVPTGVGPGLYDLVVNGELYEPKAVWVGNITGPLKIIQLTDAHMGVELDMASVYRLIHAALVASSGPYDVVLFTGDQVDVGGQIWHYQLFVKYAMLTTKPTFVIPGNHEYAGDEALANYRRFVGPPVWYRVVGPYLLVGLSSGFNGFFTDDVVEFYEKVLERYPDKVKIVLVHHPPFYRRDGFVEEVYRGPQDVDRLNRDPSGLRSYYLVYTSYLQNRRAYERFLDATVRYRVALVVSGHVHSGNSTILINGTYFVTTRTLGGSIDTSHGFRTYVVYPDGRVEVGREVLTYKSFAVATWGSKAAQIYISSDIVRGEISIDLPPNFDGIKALQGSAELVKTVRHPLGKYDRYVFKILGNPIWFVVGRYDPSPSVKIERILPRSPTPGDIVTVTIRAEDSQVGIPFLLINGSRVLASYLEEQPVYIYRFQFKRPTALEISPPGGSPQLVQIGQTATPVATTPPQTPTTTPPQTTPTTTPPETTPVVTTPVVTPTETATSPIAVQQPQAFPIEVVAILALLIVGMAVVLLRRK